MEFGIFNLMGSRDPEKPTAEIFAEVAEQTRLADQLGYSIAWFAEHQLGPIDVLINNAGMFPRVPFLEMTEHDWDHVLDVNLKGSCFCAQYVAKAMVAAGGRDRSSISLRRGAARPAPGRALRGEQGRHSVLTRAMALELAPYRIRVNAIAPGLTDTAQPRSGSSEAEIVEMAAPSRSAHLRAAGIGSRAA